MFFTRIQGADSFSAPNDSKVTIYFTSVITLGINGYRIALAYISMECEAALSY